MLNDRYGGFFFPSSFLHWEMFTLKGYVRERCLSHRSLARQDIALLLAGYANDRQKYTVTPFAFSRLPC